MPSSASHGESWSGCLPACVRRLDVWPHLRVACCCLRAVSLQNVSLAPLSQTPHAPCEVARLLCRPSRQLSLLNVDGMADFFLCVRHVGDPRPLVCPLVVVRTSSATTPLISPSPIKTARAWPEAPRMSTHRCIITAGCVCRRLNVWPHLRGACCCLRAVSLQNVSLAPSSQTPHAPCEVA